MLVLKLCVVLGMWLWAYSIFADGHMTAGEYSLYPLYDADSLFWLLDGGLNSRH